MELGSVGKNLRNVDTRLGRAVVGGTAALASFVLFASGGIRGNHDASAVAAQAPPVGPDGAVAGLSAEASTEKPAGQVQLTFDDLGGGSSTILVYPGVGTSNHDRRFDAKYNDGDTVTAICKKTGREVESDPSVGEKKRQSKEWVEFDGPPPPSDNPHQKYFATAVYVENPHQLLMDLSECK